MKQRKKGKLIEKKIPIVLTKEEIFKLFGMAKSERDRVLLKSLYYTGMRIGELIQLKKGDVNFKEDVILIRASTTKTRQEAFQPIPKILKEDLKQWCSYDENKPDDLIFPITKQRAWQIIKEYGKGIDKNIHPHTFRHTYATHIYEETNDLGKVQELLRHKSLASTGIYKHLSKKLKKKTVDDVFK